jgi:hypothetical protein
MSWDAEFKEPIILRDGRELATLREAGEFILALPIRSQKRPSVEHAGELLVRAAAEGEPEAIGDARHQLMIALRAERMI